MSHEFYIAIFSSIFALLSAALVKFFIKFTSQHNNNNSKNPESLIMLVNGIEAYKAYVEGIYYSHEKIDNTKKTILDNYNHWYRTNCKKSNTSTVKRWLKNKIGSTVTENMYEDFTSKLNKEVDEDLFKIYIHRGIGFEIVTHIFALFTHSLSLLGILLTKHALTENIIYTILILLIIITLIFSIVKFSVKTHDEYSFYYKSLKIKNSENYFSKLNALYFPPVKSCITKARLSIVVISIIHLGVIGYFDIFS